MQYVSYVHFLLAQKTVFESVKGFFVYEWENLNVVQCNSLLLWHAVTVLNLEIGVGERTQYTFSQESKRDDLLLSLERINQGSVFIDHYLVLLWQLTLLIVKGAG